MDKIKKINSLKWRMLLYIPIPIFIAFLGAYVIGVGSNSLQNIYGKRFFKDNYEQIAHIKDNYEYEMEYIRKDENGISYLIYKDEQGRDHIVPFEENFEPEGSLEKLGYYIVSNVQVVLIPLWVVLCLFIGCLIFYKREIEGGLKVLLDASEKITNNELDFEISDVGKNEIGYVCDSFECMRKSLLDTSLQNIKIIEESKRLNAAFSHDIRTPITVLKGYVELLERYIPEGKVSKEKEMEILTLMNAQVIRLENYALSMSSVQKLEDLIPNTSREDYSRFLVELENTCRMIDGRVCFTCQEEKDICQDEAYACQGDTSACQENMATCIYVDKELVFEVTENIVSNAARYAREKIEVIACLKEGMLSISVFDDGDGFSDKIISSFGRPFLREDGCEDEHHFGLGIYISKLICEKCGGQLIIDNRAGAFVQVTFKALQE